MTFNILWGVWCLHKLSHFNFYSCYMKSPEICLNPLAGLNSVMSVKRKSNPMRGSENRSRSEKTSETQGNSRAFSRDVIKSFYTIHSRKLLLSYFRVSQVKPWPNGLARRRKFWTCVQLAFRLATHLRGLATTCVDLR